MGKSLKYKIGDNLKDFTILKINDHLSSVTYEIQCKCGTLRTCDSSHMKRLTECHKCSLKRNSNSLVGQKINSFLVLDNPIYKGKRCLKVKCDCGHIYHATAYQIRNSIRCNKCKHGLYPGKVIDGITLLEYVGKRKYKIQCHCGKIYEEIPRKYRGKYADCGCSVKKRYLDSSMEKYIGTKWGNLRVTKFLRNENKHNIFQLKCKCGNTIEQKAGHFFKANSCGCLKKQNSPRADRKGNARFKNYEIISIRELHASGLYDNHDLAEMFSCDPNYICRIVTRKIWQSI